MKISHGIEYLLFRLTVAIFQSLPHRAAVSLGERLGRAACNLWYSRRRVILKNLIIAFGDRLSPEKRETLAREIFGNIGKTMAEISRFPCYDSERILALVTSEGEASFREVLDYGRGAILAGSHFGNWELMGAYINALGYPVDFLVRGQHNRYVDNYLTYLRRSCGVGVIHSESGMKEVVRALKNNRQVAIVSDQHAGSRGIIIDFFGQPVSVPRAPAQLAVKMGAPIVTGQIFRNPDNSHHCVFDKPEYPDPNADPEKEVLRLTTIFTRRIESAIRQRPELWLWTHRRFKPVAGVGSVDETSVYK